jgi:CCR4-NOT transcription complex subunit 3
LEGFGAIMGANRKLQLEIDRTLKKVAEGIEVFDQIWEKVSDICRRRANQFIFLDEKVIGLLEYRVRLHLWATEHG